MKREFLVGAVVGAVPAAMAAVNPWRELPAIHGGTDPLLQAAHLAHATRQVPGTEAFWNAPWLHPAPFAQLFVDPMVGPSLVARIVPGASSAWDYNIVLWLTVGGAFVAMAWCARRFGLSRGFAAMAGLLYAIGPYAAGHFHHLNQVPSPWLPLALGALVDLVRTRRPWWAAAAFVCTVALQLSWSVYATAALALASIVLLVVLGRGAVPWQPLLAACIGAVAVVVVGAQPYAAAARTVEGFGREATEVLAFQARWFDVWKAAGPRLLAWPTHDALRPSLYPGIGVVVLAVLGAWRMPDRRAVFALLAMVVVGFGFACGRNFLVPFTEFEIPLPYIALQDLLWPLRALRDPSRFALIAAWAGALLAAGGAQWLMGRHRTTALALLVIVALDAAPGAMERIAVEDDGKIVDALATLPAPAVWVGFPAACDEVDESARDARYMLWAVASGTRVAGGASGFVPPAIEDLRIACCAAPDAPALEAHGVEWIVSDRRLPIPAVWSDGTWSVYGVGELAPGPKSHSRP